MSHRPWFLSAALVITLVACTQEAEEPAEKCCTVAGVVEMCEEGVTPDIVVSAITASGVVLEPSPDEIIALHKACGDASVIEAFRGPEAQAEAGAEDAEDAEEPEKLPWLSLRVSHGSRGIEVFNTSSQPYTNLVLSANSTYVYRLPVTLAPGDGDYIRLGSFKNGNGIKLDKNIGVSTLYVRADQGEFSKRF